MTIELPAVLGSLDPAVLTRVVRLDQGCPDLEITDWTVKQLSDKGVINPEGLWLFSGNGSDGSGNHPWLVVLKKFKRPEGRTPDETWEGKYELRIAQSGLVERLPGPVKGPRFYEAQETPEGALIWMEHVQSDLAVPWRLEEYAFAARQIGRWNGAYLTGKPLPVESWLTKQHYRGWLGWIKDNSAAYNFPLNQKYISHGVRTRQEQLWAERERYFSVLERLPQVFSHFDCQRRNLFIRSGPDGQTELVAVDWALCGIGPVGAELYSLIDGSVVMLEWPYSTFPELKAVAFENYVKGLRDVGWSGEADVVRLGYTAWSAIWWGCVFPSAFTIWASEETRPFALQQFGVAGDELYKLWIPIMEVLLDYADEARRLAAKLGMEF